jgi:hypothetical protein
MATPAQTAANIANAQLSTGPRTAAGKSASSANAVRHGLTSARVLLPGEDPAEFDAHKAALAAYYHPETEHELHLLNRLAEESWRLDRLRRHETVFYERAGADLRKNDPALNAEEAFAMLFLDPDAQKKMRLFMRYMTAIERAHKAALTELEKALHVRQTAAAIRAQRAAMREAIGFVSKPEPSASPATPSGPTSYSGPESRCP